MLSSRIPVLSDPLEVFLCSVVHETDDIALLVNCNKASTHGNDVFDIRNVFWIQFSLA